MLETIIAVATIATWIIVLLIIAAVAVISFGAACILFLPLPRKPSPEEDRF